MKLVEPASGEILVDGKNLNLFSRPDWLSTIAWVPEEPQFPALSIRELFSLSSPNASEAKIKETLASVGLCHLNLDSSLALSVGQRRRIAIARALIGTTSMLIMDEPSASLDEETEAKIVEIIEMFAQQGKITIAVSHRQRLIEIADNIIEFSEQHK
jgi:ABC-type transport system involved in cytochrome bd biosynthesis fused ATPase/permease subunit